MIPVVPGITKICSLELKKLTDKDNEAVVSGTFHDLVNLADLLIGVNYLRASLVHKALESLPRGALVS